MSRIEVRAFRGSLPAEYGGLTPPELRPLLHRLPEDCLALGASLSGRPIGLAVAELKKAARGAKLLALAIDKSYRRRGIGRQLYSMLETLLRRKLVVAVTAEYLAEADAGEAESAFLTACGFVSPAPVIRIWSGPLRISETLPWTDRLRLPDGFACSPWSTLTSQERAAIARGYGDDYPPILDPFAEEERIDPERSLVLRHLGAPIGWMILEQFDARTVLFKSMFVQRRYQRMSRGIALSIEAFRRLIREGSYEEAIFYVEEQNAGMVRFLSRRADSPGIRKQLLWQTSKPL
ncbi:GNAT family N-acetyltransferase [Cohnella lubricantis]|uniref:GNAT family N-acetyltransferase n=1 Tax=Cohnella lubricantis TaxID=2163172 RepID=A0A841TH55_9BACL|nr:GNAT family N-acetyltransferase [Cohnella lubricantis]MBB6679726.1 GNAT family N-acetyltransferase [Cohnella lubricantis]MBP2119640.1 GNAT superfamily N-acetyltransferase [Cohnella lubricantis]